MRRNPLARAALAAFALLLLGTAAAPASACENGVQFAVDNNTPRIARAEKALNEGQFTMAAVGVLQVFSTIRSTPVSQSPLARRALRIMALASIRTEGALTAGKSWRGTTPEEQRANLNWAIDTLQALNKQRPNNPSLQTDLGEALSKSEKHREEALKLLGKLADKDLITSPHGYAALARLRALAGDKTGSDAAAKRCEGIAKKPDVCKVSAGASA
jgi:hypothetical protein